MIHRARATALRPPLPAARRRDERGSAYIVALLALVVLTIIGLSLTLVSQTEMSVGAVERTVKRVLYAADSALSESTARALTDADYEAREFDIEEPDGNPLINPRAHVEVSPFYPLLEAPCNLCEINNSAGSQAYSNNAYLAINHAVTGTATRIGGVDDPLARKTLSTMIEVQPWQSSPEARLIIDDPDELAKIKF